MKNINRIFKSSTGRTLVYLAIFIIGTALHGLMYWIINPQIWSNASVTLIVSTIFAFVLLGVILGRNQSLLSSVSSAAALFVLSFISLRIGHSVVPDQYLTLGALGVSIIAAQPIFHRKLNTNRRTILASIIVVASAMITAGLFVYAMAVLTALSIKSL